MIILFRILTLALLASIGFIFYSLNMNLSFFEYMTVLVMVSIANILGYLEGKFIK